MAAPDALKISFMTYVASLAHAPRHVSHYPSPHPLAEARVFRLCFESRDSVLMRYMLARRYALGWDAARP